MIVSISLGQFVRSLLNVHIHHLHFQFSVNLVRPVLPMEGLFSDSLCLFWYDLFPIRCRLAGAQTGKSSNLLIDAF